ncbi:hypothetical protein GCM10010423_03150 [Streptomyces levis]|uniref:Uncharacterized protein n=1 Tax=Streptomyces levis TaxID=285566 RepID=A0ABN3N8X1_9ACTN
MARRHFLLVDALGLRNEEITGQSPCGGHQGVGCGGHETNSDGRRTRGIDPGGVSFAQLETQA